MQILRDAYFHPDLQVYQARPGYKSSYLPASEGLASTCDASVGEARKRSRGVNRPFLKFTGKTILVSPLFFAAYYAYRVYDETNPGPQQPQTATHASGNRKKTLVILGSGWGAISILKNLDTTLYNVVVVSPRNYFLFTPLLPSCPTGTIEYRSIIEPVRTVAKRRPGEVTYYEAEATDIDATNNKLTLKQTLGSDAVKAHGEDTLTVTLDYDYLVVGVGAQPNTFGIPGVLENSCFLKELPDSQKIRKQFMDCIETATLLPKGSAERARLLRTVVVGGGPTGVEFAAELQDYIDGDIRKWNPEIAAELKVTLVEALPNVLNMMNKKLIDYTEGVLRDLGIELMTGAMVKKVDENEVHAAIKQENGELKLVDVPYGLLVWATGNGTRDIVKNLSSKIPEQKNATRGLLVNECMMLQGSKNIFALGDCTFTKNPPTAQVAQQEGQYLASALEVLARVDDLEYQLYSTEIAGIEKERVQRRLHREQKAIQPFKYQHMGVLAYIGSERAVADLVWGDQSFFKNLNNISVGGTFTFFFWKSAYVQMLLSTKNQVLVTVDWIKVALFGRDVSKE
ncbi:hypothetical protein BABINDRAFT_171770 [Babjeviella inositovora NRRL Y-12698]|uniref:NADH:ubiquinone reductase (non-electrogenic) n=1 Tax=Babjeviella inositovora NRRL Y-12698 TaxID=984486 RepID=A0A1E3QRP7_9ASCO|nr:uncharacterized protein BABINDRAFT_171770 [Babjeviella inositovora NRRL Y-12698]ODQ79617.1 hypothetical protein BABINDRAFT_171770 [Babjeviella inositovora NRRL Y-12698]